MKSNRHWLLVLVLLLATGHLWAQKSLIKGDAPTPAVNDSVKAEMAKAAMRASLLMKGSRDSLQATNVEPPVAVVDSFAAAPKSDPAFTMVKASQFADARKRIADAEADLAKAAKALAAASQAGTATDKELEAAAERIRVQTDNLATITKRLDAVESEWKRSHHTEVPKPAAAPTPKAPPAPTTPSPKGSMTKGSGTPSTAPAAEPVSPKPNPKKLK